MGLAPLKHYPSAEPVSDRCHHVVPGYRQFSSGTPGRVGVLLEGLQELSVLGPVAEAGRVECVEMESTERSVVVRVEMKAALRLSAAAQRGSVGRTGPPRPSDEES